VVSMMDILSGAAPLMGDIRQSGPGPRLRWLQDGATLRVARYDRWEIHQW
jgi:hypothetical protein